MKQIVSVVLVISGIAALLAAALLPARFGHPVTPQMQQAADSAAGTSVVALPGMARGRPQIVVFILPGCPCSDAYEPFTHIMHRAYGQHVDIVGVIAGNQEDMKKWQSEHQTPFPLIADSDLQIARSYSAERSAYTALLLDDQTVVRLWPGYSVTMLNELTELLSSKMGTTLAPLDTNGAPATLTSGCELTK